MGPHLLTTRDVAALLRVHPKHVYRLRKRGLPAVRVGDEWRFVREDVLAWAGRDGTVVEPPASVRPVTIPGHVAANGDLAVEVLLGLVNATALGPIGFVLADHAHGRTLLADRRVLAAGAHAGLDAPGPSVPAVRVRLVRREVGLAFAKGKRLRSLGSIAGKRLASRPQSAGIRQRLDRALEAAGVDGEDAYEHAPELACHRDVALAVARDEADVGLTTHAWAAAVGLSFFAIGEEDYDLAFAAESMGDPRVLAICEAAQTAALRRRLGGMAGYAVSRTGETRFR